MDEETGVTSPVYSNIHCLDEVQVIVGVRPSPVVQICTYQHSVSISAAIELGRTAEDLRPRACRTRDIAALGSESGHFVLQELRRLHAVAQLRVDLSSTGCVSGGTGRSCACAARLGNRLWFRDLPLFRSPVVWPDDMELCAAGDPASDGFWPIAQHGARDATGGGLQLQIELLTRRLEPIHSAVPKKSNLHALGKTRPKGWPSAT